MTQKAQRAVEMTGYGKRGKPKARFPSFPTALGNRKTRDSHIPAAPTTTAVEKVEIQKQDFHFPTAASLDQRQEERRTLLNAG